MVYRKELLIQLFQLIFLGLILLLQHFNSFQLSIFHRQGLFQSYKHGSCLCCR